MDKNETKIECNDKDDTNENDEKKIELLFIEAGHDNQNIEAALDKTKLNYYFEFSYISLLVKKIQSPPPEL